MSRIEKDSKIVIVGAGVFGLSTAEYLLKRGYTAITILDRSAELPAPDAASCDINKIVRSSYSDPFYTKLAKDAVDLWRDQNQWGDTYHDFFVRLFQHATQIPDALFRRYRSGVFVISSGGSGYGDGAYQNDVALGVRLKDLKTPEEIKSIFPPGVKTASFEGASGYINYDGGWAFASQGVAVLLERVKKLGAVVYPGKGASDLIKAEDGTTKGVKTTDGSSYDADLVVIASGSWTPSTFPKLNLYDKCLATGQVLATIQLTPEEAERYRNTPVILSFESGFYSFPPNADNIVKFAIHGRGYLHQPNNGPSTPRTKLSDGQDGLRIPKQAVKDLRAGLATVYPELSQKPFVTTRLCWYNDSPDDDFVIGYHPTDSRLVLATSGSGHAYKFLPNIGRLVADAIEGKLEPELVKKFALDRASNDHLPWRSDGSSRPLNLAELCTADDLLP
ncbi:FAD dependent oxidoreductase [Irpex rosettiformis]|uniref:FAD dependent oxidoreductase n=1 Tax=Irpex rosettiformis TaxID=378272 RepID=A0ACB8U971_9APHY|nr:FAD dependent oxidoreductase [Irpex rosettiformis]